jgi:hypothetical protein
LCLTISGTAFYRSVQGGGSLQAVGKDGSAR